MKDKPKHHWTVSTRRQFFEQAGSGLAAIALANLLEEDAWAQAKKVDPLDPKTPHVAPRAKYDHLVLHGRRTQPRGSCSIPSRSS